MHARVFRIVESGGDANGQADGSLSLFRAGADVQPGYAGTTLLLQGDSGARLSVSFWQDERALPWSDTAAGEGARQMPEDYEVAVRHLPHDAVPGNWVRVTGFLADPSRIDDGISHFHAAVLPDLSRIAGFRGALFLVNRVTGNVLATTIWTDQKDFEAGAAQGAPIRARAAEVMAATNPRVESYELVDAGPLGSGK